MIHTPVPHIALHARVPVFIAHLALTLHAPEGWGYQWLGIYAHRHSRSHFGKDISHEGGIVDVVEESAIGGAGVFTFGVADCGQECCIEGAEEGDEVGLVAGRTIDDVVATIMDPGEILYDLLDGEIGLEGGRRTSGGEGC